MDGRTQHILSAAASRSPVSNGVECSHLLAAGARLRRLGSGETEGLMLSTQWLPPGACPLLPMSKAPREVSSVSTALPRPCPPTAVDGGTKPRAVLE